MRNTPIAEYSPGKVAGNVEVRVIAALASRNRKEGDKIASLWQPKLVSGEAATGKKGAIHWKELIKN
ncbi:hypothetical protein BRADI_4g28915v3 [Brachypodium distachyon]|uniref:Uncharacterized protein n=1 Tax=Brachypodium distachyon TaxID=15368 RepID=A0A2K2CQZ1_BRADI|nr:hypothetical protein BRADI_4g28915v3 [Brachypodium distachyon]